MWLGLLGFLAATLIAAQANLVLSRYQIDVATTVTTPILIAVLAIIAGVIIVGAGGGLIKPMQQRWETMLTKAQEEAPKIQQEVQNAPSLAEQAQQAKTQAQSATRTQTQGYSTPPRG